MFQRLKNPLLALVLLLTACRGKPEIAVTPVPPTSTVSSASRAGCTVVSSIPTPGPTQPSLFPPVSDADWVHGPASARVTIVEYSDFQCSYCAQLALVLAQIQKDYPGEVRVVFRHYPLIGTPQRPIHDKAALSVQASEAAGAQDKFWEMHDLLFERQAEWMTMTLPQYQDWLVARAGELKLEPGRFSTDLTSQANAAKAQKAYDDARAIGIPSAPFLLVNGQIWPQDLPLDYGSLSAIIKLTQLEEKQFTSCPPMTIDPKKQYTATLHTQRGNIVMELYPDKAPLAVNSFVFLARKGWYNGVIFHRVLPGVVAQAGDPTGTGFGGPGYAFDNEISPDLKFDAAGVVGMANAGPGSNMSQFFIALSPRPDWNGGYTVFGRVISGMDVVESLTPRDPTQPGVLPQGDIIESVTIDEK